MMPGVALKAVVFDIGGVLESTPRTGWQDRWARRLGIGRAALDQHLEEPFELGSVGALDLVGVERQIGSALRLDPSDVSELMEELWVEYLGELNEELARYFAALRPRHRTGILSNSFVGAREREERAYGFSAMCDVVVYSHEEGMLKPDPRFYALVCERLGVRPQETVFLDDSPEWVAGAQRAGMQAVRFVENPQAMTELDALLDEASGGVGE
jgi:putative hydrolase of the HAD superfamily